MQTNTNLELASKPSSWCTPNETASVSGPCVYVAAVTAVGHCFLFLLSASMNSKHFTAATAFSKYKYWNRNEMTCAAVVAVSTVMLKRRVRRVHSTDTKTHRHVIAFNYIKIAFYLLDICVSGIFRHTLIKKMGDGWSWRGLEIICVFDFCVICSSAAGDHNNLQRQQQIHYAHDCTREQYKINSICVWKSERD